MSWITEKGGDTSKSVRMFGYAVSRNEIMPPVIGLTKLLHFAGLYEF